MTKIILDDSTYINKQTQTIREMAAQSAMNIYNEVYAANDSKKVDKQYFHDYFDLMKTLNKANYL